MPHYAVMDSTGKVMNIIIADSLEHAEEHSGYTCIETTNETRWPSVGWEFFEDVFREPQPESTVWNSVAKMWEMDITK